MKMKSRVIASCFSFIIIALLFLSCAHIDTFEKNTSIPNYQWQTGFKATGSFVINDTTPTYNTYIILRHTDAFKYNNIWLNVGLQMPNDSMKYQKINIPLGTDATGWMGIGMNDIWQIRHLIATNRFKKGKYSFSIEQIMRDNPLPNVMSAGLRLEKQ